MARMSSDAYPEQLKRDGQPSQHGAPIVWFVQVVSYPSVDTGSDINQGRAKEGSDVVLRAVDLHQGRAITTFEGSAPRLLY
eukprot:SAG31_NODE_17_length_35773_cov_25.999271_36_plen_81_part_00